MFAQLCDSHFYFSNQSKMLRNKSETSFMLSPTCVLEQFNLKHWIWHKEQSWYLGTVMFPLLDRMSVVISGTLKT